MESSSRSWKPVSLRLPTLLIYLGFVVTLIILLESASLALPKSQISDDETEPTNDTVIETLAEIVATSTEAYGYRIRSTPTFEPSSEFETRDGSPILPRGDPNAPTAPAPNIGWLLLDGDGWLSAGTAYFIGTFLPTPIASIFAIPWKIIDLEAKSLEPFAQLARPGGGTASQTLLLQYNGASGLVSAFVGIFTGHSAVAFSTYLMYGAALLTPLAAESVHLALRGECLQDSTKHCTATLQASNPVIRTAQALLAAMTCFVIAYIILLRGRIFGASSDPRSILGIASHSLNPYLGACFQKTFLGPDGMFSATCAARALGNRRFEFGYVTYPSGQQEYGIVVDDGVGDAYQMLGALTPKADWKVSSFSSISGILVKVISFAPGEEVASCLNPQPLSKFLEEPLIDLL
ncbi:hypothetical protein F53441_289 [Fusarium austroafricanum]|uniref:Uncharacterized protein n=1 Tax=Fusarium austroafricanum TaxID=2364996 RepID=A0A8H4P6J0_9HYPO|nr:hypothetical protein F53441_289 [Fusarium austroafricanum]